MEGEVHLIESGPLRSCILVFRLSIPQGEGGVEGACAPAPVCSQGKGHPGFTPWLLHVCAAAIASLGMPPGALRWQGSQAEGGAVTSCSSVEMVRERRDWEQIQMSPGGSGEAPGPSLLSVSMVPDPSFPH